MATAVNFSAVLQPSSLHYAIRKTRARALRRQRQAARQNTDTKDATRMDINLKTLIGKLNDTSRRPRRARPSICVGLGQYEVDLEHLFLALLEQPDSDFVVAARASATSA